MIIIDDREPEKIVKYIRELVGEENCKVERLPVGDIVCPEKGIAIERKEVGDFMGSVMSQRIFDQVRQMKENYPNTFVIVSGTYRDLLTNPHLFNVNIHVLLGAQASIVSKHHVPLLVVENDKQLAYLAVKIIEKNGELDTTGVVRRLTSDLGSLKISALTAVKGISRDKATRIMEKYPRISDLCKATQDELTEIDGIGKVLSFNIKEIFN